MATLKRPRFDVERRFASVICGDTNDWMTIVVTRIEHQRFTSDWRQAIGYGQDTITASRDQVENAARRIYAEYPEILDSLGL